MSLTTMDEGRFIDINESFLNMSGYTRDEVLGRTAHQLSVWEQPEARQLYIKALREKGSVKDMEMRFRTKSGAIRTLLLAAELVDTDGQKCILVSSADVTELKQAEQRLSELSARLLQAQEQERRRIARELHDVTAQGIGLILFNLAYIRNSAPQLAEPARTKLEESISLGEQALREIRTLSYLLHPPLLDQAGLITAIQWYVKGFSERSGIRVEFVESGSEGHRMPPEIEHTLFRVVQECLTNITRHTTSATAEITLRRSADQVTLEVRDHGTEGNVVSPVNGDTIESIGVGVPGMRHRLNQLGGELSVTSDSTGTTVTATVPEKVGES